MAFDEIRPEYRKNFSNYAPVINHLLELLDDPEADKLMRFFPKLKSKDKHLDQVGKRNEKKAFLFPYIFDYRDFRAGAPLGEGVQPGAMAVSLLLCLLPCFHGRKALLTPGPLCRYIRH